MSHKTIQEYIRSTPAYKRGGEIIRPSAVTSVMAANGRKSEHRVIVNVLSELVRAGELVETDEGIKRDKRIATLLARSWRYESNHQVLDSTEPRRFGLCYDDDWNFHTVISQPELPEYLQGLRLGGGA